jgi:hypothetical protein
VAPRNNHAQYETDRKRGILGETLNRVVVPEDVAVFRVPGAATCHIYNTQYNSTFVKYTRDSTAKIIILYLKAALKLGFRVFFKNTFCRTVVTKKRIGSCASFVMGSNTWERRAKTPEVECFLMQVTVESYRIAAY